MRYYAVEYKIRDDNNMTLDDYKLSEGVAESLPKNEMYEFNEYDLYKDYFKTKEEQLGFVLSELGKWSWNLKQDDGCHRRLVMPIFRLSHARDNIYYLICLYIRY